jgi:predicted nucleic acid-binding protein
MTASDRLPVLVLDAGPLIGLLNRRDSYHQDALRGFEDLGSARTDLHITLPILVEVYKWLLFRTDLRTAHRALEWMLEDLRIFYLGPTDLDEMVRLVMSRSEWTGTLEDTSVVLAAIRLDAPVWTIDYGDLSAFPAIRFWTPG